MLPKPPYFDEERWGADTWPLLSASYTGDADTVARMVDEDRRRVRAQFAYYEPLHYAVRGGHRDVVELLLARGADPNAEGWSGKPLGDETPIAKAADRERDDLVSLLMNAVDHPPAPVVPAPPDPQQVPQETVEYELFAASHGGRVDVVERILTDRPDLATSGLYEGVHQGHLDVVRLLLAAGADVSYPFLAGCWYTPLMHCVRYPRPRLAIGELLLTHGFPVSSTNGLGMTSLHVAALSGTAEAVTWLLDHGADINFVEPEFGSTPLGWTARWGRHEMTRLLLDRGADPTLPPEPSWARPLHWAKKKGHTQVADLLA